LFDGNWLNTSGAYVAQDLNSRGCDSTTFLDLMVVSQILVNDTLEICEGDSVWINNGWEKTEGTYTTLIPGITCDTSILTWLEVHPNYFYEIIYDACPGDSFLIDMVIYTQPGTVISHATSIFGCDSTTVHDITMPSFPSPPVITYDCLTGIYTAASANADDWFNEWSNGNR
jgi:hypothetical protein